MSEQSNAASRPTLLRVADLRQSRPTAFDLRPDAARMREIATELGIEGLRKLSFKGQLMAEGRRDWRLEGTIGATVIQACVVTLAPVTTRIDEPVLRRFMAEPPVYDETEDEIEIPEDDSVEALGSEIDLETVMIEALALALPLYPRADDVAPVDISVTEPGTEALTDEAVKPFAGLAALRDQLAAKDDDATD